MEDSFALIFGINTLFALFIMTLLTIIVTSGSVLVIHIADQFIIYGGYFVALGGIYGLSGVVQKCLQFRRAKSSAYDLRE